MEIFNFFSLYKIFIEMSEEGNQLLTDIASSRRPSIEGYLVSGSKYRLLGKYFAAGLILICLI